MATREAARRAQEVSKRGRVRKEPERLEAGPASIEWSSTTDPAEMTAAVATRKRSKKVPATPRKCTSPEGSVSEPETLRPYRQSQDVFGSSCFVFGRFLVRSCTFRKTLRTTESAITHHWSVSYYALFVGTIYRQIQTDLTRRHAVNSDTDYE